MDISLTVQSVNIIPSTRDWVTAEIGGLDPEELMTKEFVKEISMYDLFEHLDGHQKTDLQDQLIDDNLDIILDSYDPEEILGHFTLDDILNYFEKNLISHL